jgi:sec-independent protein translocase protein TatC
MNRQAEERNGAGLEPDDNGDGLRKSFLGHLEDLRTTLIGCLLSAAAGMLLCLPLAPRILRVLKWPLARAGRNPDEFLRVLEVTAGFTVTARIVFWAGLLLSLPLMALFVARFVFPGLKRRERRAVTRSLAFAAALFAVGVLMGYFVMLPVGLRMMFQTSAWVGAPQAFIELGDYVGFSLMLLLAFGITFELPVALLALGAFGIVTSRQLRDKRRHIVVALMIISAVVTPADPYTMILMACPLIALFEACIWLIRARERRAGDQDRPAAVR